jgi:hypothetical protein
LLLLLTAHCLLLTCFLLSSFLSFLAFNERPGSFPLYTAPSWHDAAFTSGPFFFEAGTTGKAIAMLSIDEIRAYDDIGYDGVEEHPAVSLFVKI